MARFENKVALITGGGSGIGRATALRIAGEGARVALVGRTREKLEAVASEIGADRALVLPASHDEPADVSRAVAAVVSELGRIDVLFNNAGTFEPRSLMDTTPDAWMASLATNLTGPFLVAREVIPHMRRQGGGVVIHNSSTLGMRPVMGAAAYSVAKAGLIMLGKVLALEEASHGIRSLVICPGVVDTRIHCQRDGVEDDSLPAFLDEMEKIHPLGRVGTPDEVAALVCHLASDEAAWMTGSVVTIDGGVVLA